MMERATVSAQTQPNRAAVVARFADGQNLVKCVTFPEDSITGEELLRRTGWSIVIDAETDKGSAICKVNDVGCGVDDCFCRCRGGAQCEYWSYWHRVNNEWEYADSGAGSYNVSDGALEGWSWGPGNWVTGTEPPDFTFQQICNTNTNPIVRDNTPEPDTDQPPDGDFDADEILVESGACTILSWVIFDATSVTLDGVEVVAAGSARGVPADDAAFRAGRHERDGPAHPRGNDRSAGRRITGSGAGRAADRRAAATGSRAAAARPGQ